MRLVKLIALALALAGVTQVSCKLKDYCLACEKEDGRSETLSAAGLGR